MTGRGGTAGMEVDDNEEEVLDLEADAETEAEAEVDAMEGVKFLNGD